MRRIVAMCNDLVDLVDLVDLIDLVDPVDPVDPAIRSDPVGSGRTSRSSRSETI
jgi:hypothetical protein